MTLTPREGRRLLIRADRSQIVAHFGTSDVVGDQQHHDQHSEDHIVEAALVQKLHSAEAAQPVELHAERRAGVDAENGLVRIENDADNVAQRDRREREVRALQTEARNADQQGRKTRDQTGDEQTDPRRAVKMRKEDRRRIRAEADKAGVAEGHLTRITAEDVPGRGASRRTAGSGTGS